MKKLLNKTLIILSIYSLIVLATSVPVYYYLIDNIWLGELDEHNTIIAQRIEKELNKIQLNEIELTQSITLLNKIQPGINLKNAQKVNIYEDSIYTTLVQNPYVDYENIDRFRGLKKLIYINKKAHLLTVETNIEETGETIIAISIIAFLFFLILIIGFLLLNQWLSIRLWKPFRSTLYKLKTFNLNNRTEIKFEKSNILEFEELNTTLYRLLENNISIYKIQKEFTENASHELQTPLAIIRNKLDLLLQKEPITERQYQIIEKINKTLTRITRINKNLLLLAKIESNQFNDMNNINLDQLIQQCLDQLREYSDNKNIIINIEISNNVTINGNKILIEILLNNLLLNAIRHNEQNGVIYIFLDKEKIVISNSGNSALSDSYIFKRFAKVSNENTGSGLGLAIINQICNHHNWVINYNFSGGLHNFSIIY